MRYSIAMGVRKGDEALKRKLQAVLDRRHAEVQALLAAYHVPLVEPAMRARPARSDATSAGEHGGRIFVTNERSGELSVIDARSRAVVATLPLGKRPRGMQLSPDGQRLYVALSGSPIGGPHVDESRLPPPDKQADGIGVVDVAGLRLLRVLRGVSDPEQLALSPDGRKLYVASEDTGTAVVLDEADGRVLATLTVGHEPEGIAISPDGRWVYVASEAEDEISVIDTQDDSIAATIRTCARPRAIVFSTRVAEAYASCENGAAVAVLDPRRHAELARIALPGEGARPMGLALAPDGGRLYVSTGRGGTIAAIDTRARRVAGSVEVGPRPWGITLSADGRWLYSANGPSNDVSVVDARRLEVVDKVAVRTSPWGALAEDSGRTSRAATALMPISAAAVPARARCGRPRPRSRRSRRSRRRVPG
jgi:YVTN family beta-propeller protein